jgi:hypothetical protein
MNACLRSDCSDIRLSIQSGFSCVSLEDLARPEACRRETNQIGFPAFGNFRNDLTRPLAMLNAKLAEFVRREKTAHRMGTATFTAPAFGFWRAVCVVGGFYFNHVSTFAVKSR